MQPMATLKKWTFWRFGEKRSCGSALESGNKLFYKYLNA